MNTKISTRRIVKFLIATVVASALSVSQVSPAAAEEYVNVLQYELGLNAKKRVSNFYLSWQPRMGTGFGQSWAESSLTHNLSIQPQPRVPLYSSDPYKRTLFNLVPLTMNVDESADTSGESGDGLKKFGQGVLAVTLLGGMLYVRLKEAEAEIKKWQ
jgi:hypothetical protein